MTWYAEAVPEQRGGGCHPAVAPLLCACHHLLCPPRREPSADFGPKVSFCVLVRMAPAAARPLPWAVLQAGCQHRSARANSQPAAAAAGLSVGLADAPSSESSLSSPNSRTGVSKRRWASSRGSSSPCVHGAATNPRTAADTPTQPRAQTRETAEPCVVFATTD